MGMVVCPAYLGRGGLKQKGFRKAHDQLADARHAARRMASAESLDQAEREWAAFLEHFARLFNKLLVACKDDPRAYPWFGRKKAEREKNEMLVYLHQARHSHEHSLDDITERTDAYLGIGGPGEQIFVKELRFDDRGRISGSVSGTPKVTVTKGPAKLRLLPVSNRGVTYHPPKEELVAELEATPWRICDAALEYAEQLLAEAAQFLER